MVSTVVEFLKGVVCAENLFGSYEFTLHGVLQLHSHDAPITFTWIVELLSLNGNEMNSSHMYR